MLDHREPIRQALAALEQQRRQIDSDIAALKRILARDEAVDSEPAPRPERAASGGEPKPQAARGEAEREIIELLADGAIRKPGEIAHVRGTTSNAASNVLRRLRKKGIVADLGGGRYQLAPNGAQGSLSAPAEGEVNEGMKGGAD